MAGRISLLSGQVLRIPEVGAGGISAGKVSAKEISAGAVRMGEIHPNEFGVVEVGVDKLGEDKDGLGEDDAGEVGTADVDLELRPLPDLRRLTLAPPSLASRGSAPPRSAWGSRAWERLALARLVRSSRAVTRRAPALLRPLRTLAGRVTRRSSIDVDTASSNTASS